VNARAPGQVVEISNPATDGSIITLNSNSSYFVQTCFTPALDTNYPSLFTVTVNGVAQPASRFLFGGFGAAGCPGLDSFYFHWTITSPGTTTGTNVLQVVYSNTNTGVTLSDTRTVIVPSPLVISGLGSDNQLVLWDSTPGVNYQVLATTNLSQPFEPISGIIPSQGTTTSFYDANLAPQKFYVIELLQ